VQAGKNTERVPGQLKNWGHKRKYSVQIFVANQLRVSVLRAVRPKNNFFQQPGNAGLAQKKHAKPKIRSAAESRAFSVLATALRTFRESRRAANHKRRISLLFQRKNKFFSGPSFSRAFAFPFLDEVVETASRPQKQHGEKAHNCYLFKFQRVRRETRRASARPQLLRGVSRKFARLPGAIRVFGARGSAACERNSGQRLLSRGLFNASRAVPRSELAVLGPRFQLKQ
jgi:hypothetical protein